MHLHSWWNFQSAMLGNTRVYQLCVINHRSLFSSKLLIQKFLKSCLFTTCVTVASVKVNKRCVVKNDYLIRELRCPTLGKGKSSKKKCLWKGYVSSFSHCEPAFGQALMYSKEIPKTFATHSLRQKKSLLGSGPKQTSETMKDIDQSGELFTTMNMRERPMSSMEYTPVN